MSDVGIEFRPAASRFAVAIALELLQIAAVIRVVMQDRSVAILAGGAEIESARGIESWLAGHGGESGWRTNQSMP